jgi:hypothetical protein
MTTMAFLFGILSAAQIITIGLVLIAALAACVLLFGCASPGPYRTDADADHQIVENHSAEGYQVGYIEFDEQGWFWMPDSGTGDIGYRKQVREVENMIASAAQLDPSKPKSARGIILVAFVHGWRNNAAPNQSNNVPQFKSMLADLAAKERAQYPQSPREVVGVYIGWPGLSADVEPFETASFYSRKNTADRVGLYGGVTEVLSRLESLNDSINEALPKDSPASFYVVVGHSFGAQVVYGSVLQIMTQRVAEQRVSKFVENHRLSPGAARAESLPGRQLTPGGNPLQPFGDLVVLINPAFEGERYFNLKTLSEQFFYPPQQRPVLAIFCSETDSATGFWFPIGRFFSTFLERYRPSPLGNLQKQTNLRTIPWTDDFVTHQLLAVEDYTKTFGPLPPAIPWSEAARAVPREFGDCVLVPNPDNKSPWTPFYVVKVDQVLINGHNDIWEPRFTSFLEQFIATTNKKSASTAPRRLMRVSRNSGDAAPASTSPQP